MITWYIIIISTCILAAFVPAKQSVPNTESLSDNDEITKRSKGIFFVILVGTILTLAAGLRFAVGTDYGNYARLYQGYVNDWWNNVLTFNEPGLSIIAKISSLFNSDYAGMFFLVSLITIPLYVRTIYKNCDSFWLGITLYLLSGEWQHSFNGIKQYLAAAILFSGYRFLINREFKKYLLVVLLASCFHISALVMLLLYFFVPIKFGLKTAILMIISVIVIQYSYDFMFNMISNIDATFSFSDYVTGGVKWQRVAVSFAPFILLLFMSKDDKSDKETNALINLISINAVIMIACSNSRYLTRLSYYTQIYPCLAIPRFIRSFDDKQKHFFVIITILLYAVFWYIETKDTLFFWIFNRV